MDQMREVEEAEGLGPGLRVEGAAHQVAEERGELSEGVRKAVPIGGCEGAAGKATKGGSSSLCRRPNWSDPHC